MFASDFSTFLKMKMLPLLPLLLLPLLLDDGCLWDAEMLIGKSITDA